MIARAQAPFTLGAPELSRHLGPGEGRRSPPRLLAALVLPLGEQQRLAHRLARDPEGVADGGEAFTPRTSKARSSRSECREF